MGLLDSDFRIGKLIRCSGSEFRNGFLIGGTKGLYSSARQ